MRPDNNYKNTGYKKKVSAAYGFGVAKIVAGIMLFSLGIVFVIVGVVAVKSLDNIGVSTNMLLYYLFEMVAVSLALSGVFLILGGADSCRLVRSYQKLMLWMKFKNRESLYVLSNVTKQNLTQLVSDLRRMSAKDFFPRGRIDIDRAELAIEDDGAPPPMLKDGDTVLSEKTRIPYGTLWTFPLVWAIYALFRPYPTWYDLAAAGAVSLVTFIIAAARANKVHVITEKKYKAPPTPVPVPINTGNTPLDELLNTATGYIGELNGLSLSITNEKMVSPVNELLSISRQVFAFVEKQPEKIRQIRQFMNYYLPTTVKLLQSYKDFSSEPLKGENIKSSMAKIEESMDGIVETFRRELDNLYSDKATDITVDIDVMLSMMRSQGISSDFAGTQRKNVEN